MIRSIWMVLCSGVQLVRPFPWLMKDSLGSRYSLVDLCRVGVLENGPIFLVSAFIELVYIG